MISQKHHSQHIKTIQFESVMGSGCPYALWVVLLWGEMPGWGDYVAKGGAGQLDNSNIELSGSVLITMY
jgi:hypothetical protein